MRQVLIIIFLACLASIGFAEEITDNIIMPNKLVYNELPDDYPKELDELFDFFYNEAQAVTDNLHKLRGNSTKKIYDIIYDRVKKTDEEKKFRILYLDWLARNTIPLYYGEFKALHCNREFIFSIPEKKRKSISYMPTKVIELWKNNIRIPWIGNINGLIKKSLQEKYPDKGLKFISYSGYFFWIKGIVTESSYFERKTLRQGINNTKNYVRLKIDDAIGNEFKGKDIIIEIFSGNNVTLTVGNTYLIPVNCNYYNYKFEDKIKFSNRLIGNEPVNYSSSEGAIYNLENGAVCKRRTSVFYGEPYWGSFPHKPNEGEITYTVFKKRMESVISFLKNKAKMEY